MFTFSLLKSWLIFSSAFQHHALTHSLTHIKEKIGLSACVLSLLN